MELAATIQRRVAAATARADRLTQAILAKAFRGELVPTEAELARQGREYEPAWVLLERIRAARAAAASDSKGTARNRRSRPTKKSRAIKKTVDRVSVRGRRRASRRSYTGSPANDVRVCNVPPGEAGGTRARCLYRRSWCIL